MKKFLLMLTISLVGCFSDSILDSSESEETEYEEDVLQVTDDTVSEPSLGCSSYRQPLTNHLGEEIGSMPVFCERYWIDRGRPPNDSRPVKDTVSYPDWFLVQDISSTVEKEEQ